ncbi:MAG TPA: metal-dependent hydrolase [Polyangia bacterium]|jgi:inner membrane protein|nr:metal-dependent hydrolase [Polyangia bacterium]
MASIGHVLVGAAASKAYRTGQPTIWSPFAAAALWAGLSLLPDVDVIGFPLGVRYEDEWGHRGATHSLVFALAIAAVVGLIARAARRPTWRTALFAAAVVASHPLLDTMTDGGLGCALLWPFSNERFFAPWRPIPVAPIGPAFLSMAGLRIAAVETAAMLPFLIYALWSAAQKRATRTARR